MYPPIIRIYNGHILKVVKLWCDSAIDTSWYYSMTKGLGYNQKAIDHAGQDKNVLNLRLLDQWEQGYYYCFGYDNNTNTNFLSEAEVRLYGIHMILLLIMLEHNNTTVITK